MSLLEAILKTSREWAVPREPRHRGKAAGLRMVCDVAPGPAKLSALDMLSCPPPVPLLELWHHTASARLFRDAEYGQWGLEFLTPQQVATETAEFRRSRGSEYRAGDLVIGRFLGDSDLLLVRCAHTASDYGQVVIALPLDGRDDWFWTGLDLNEFAEQYVAGEGDKFWQVAPA